MCQNESFMKQPFHLHLYWFYLKSAQVIMHVFLIAKKATWLKKCLVKGIQVKTHCGISMHYRQL